MSLVRRMQFRLMVFCLIAACLSIGASAQTDPKSPLGVFGKNIESGKLAETEKDLFNYVIANPKDANGFLLLAKLRLGQNRLNEAKSLLNKALSLDPDLLAAKLTLVSVNFESGEIALARENLKNIADSEISDPRMLLSAAQIAARVGDCARSLKLAEKLPPTVKNAGAAPFRAACYLEIGDRKNFALLIPQAKILAKKNPAVAVQFAEVLSKHDMPKETAELLRLVVAAAPQNTAALLLLAKSEIILGNFANAKIRLARAEKIVPQSADLLFVKSLLESEQGNNAAALELLEQSLTANSAKTEALARYVIVSLRANQTGKAVRAAEKLLNLEPQNLEFLYLHGIAALQNNNLQKAETSLTRFLEARPRDSRGCLALGLTFAGQTDKINEARAQMEQCLAINPKNYEAAYQLGLSYKVEGNTAKAIEYLEQTIRVFPDYAVALRDLGAVYLQSGGEAKARAALEKAVALNPNDAETHFQLSRLYNLLGERELGKKHLEIFQKLKNPKTDPM